MEDEDLYNIGGYSSSDDDKNESSDDEFVEKRLSKQKQESMSSSEDEFEKEMQMELENVMRSYENDLEGNVNCDPETCASRNSGQNTETTEDLYSEDYFSSGSDDEHLVGGQGSKSKERRKVLTNDELLYDPDMDDEDEKWVIQQRQDHRQKVQQRKSASSAADANESPAKSTANKTKSRQAVEKVPSSDAILSCPACMTTLCIDCQRHELYKNQYRAMFVMNCKVVEDEVLRYEPMQQRNSGQKKKKKQKGKLVQDTGKKDSLASDGAASERYHPVTCTECSSEVAVYDNDEVYHFFNVLASHA